MLPRGQDADADDEDVSLDTSEGLLNDRHGIPRQSEEDALWNRG